MLRKFWRKKLFILFVLHEEFFCLKEVVVEVDFVDLKVPNVSSLDSSVGNKRDDLSMFTEI